MRNYYFLLIVVYFLLVSECNCNRRSNKLKPLQNYRFNDFKPRKFTNQFDDELSQVPQSNQGDSNNFDQHESVNSFNQQPLDDDNEDVADDDGNEPIDDMAEYNDINDYGDMNADEDEEETENFNNNKNEISVKKELSDYNYNYDTNDDPIEFDEHQDEQMNKIKREVINSYADDLTQNIETMSDDEIGLALSNLSQNELETLYKLISSYDSNENSEQKMKRETNEDTNAFHNEFDEEHESIHSVHPKRCNDRKSKPSNKKNCIFRRFNSNSNSNKYNRMKREDEEDQQTNDSDVTGANLSSEEATVNIQNDTKPQPAVSAPAPAQPVPSPPPPVAPAQPPPPAPPVHISHTANISSDVDHAAKSTSLINSVEPSNYYEENEENSNTVKRKAKRFASTSSLAADRRIEAKIDYLRDKYKRQMLMKQMDGGKKRSSKGRARRLNRPAIRRKRSNDGGGYLNPMDDPQSPEHIKLLEESFPNPRSSNTLHQNNVPLVRVKRDDY